MVEIEVPQGTDVLGFVTADLALFAALFRADFARATVGRQPRLAEHTVRLHIPPDRAIRAERSQRRVGLRRRRQVVVVQLVGPVRMVAVLPPQMLGQPRSQRDLAAVLAHAALEHPDRVVILTRFVVPALEGGGGKADLAGGDRMRPGLRGEGAEGHLEFSARRGSAEQRAHHGEAKARPQGCGR